MCVGGGGGVDLNLLGWNVLQQLGQFVAGGGGGGWQGACECMVWVRFASWQGCFVVPF